MENYLEKEKKLKRYYIALGIYELLEVISAIGTIILNRFIKADASTSISISAISTIVLAAFLAVGLLNKSPRICGYTYALFSLRSFLNIMISVIKGEFEVENIKGIVLIVFYIFLAYGFLNINKIKAKQYTVIAIGFYIVYGIIAVIFEIFEQINKEPTFSIVVFFSSYYIVNFIVSTIINWFIVKIIVTENEISD